MNVAPFRAVRYDASRVGDLGRVVSLPYDQLDEQACEERRQSHPHNVVRLIRPRGGDAADARDALERWLEEGVLQQDSTPSLYPYRQRFASRDGGGVDERWALIGALELSPLDGGEVRPHEGTFPDIVAERCRLRDIVGADLGLLLILYDDPDGTIDGRVRQAAEAPSLAEVEDGAGTENALWRWQEPELLASVCEALRPRRGIIADGHHRYTAALRHWQGVGADLDDPARFIMVALVSQQAPGLTILPVHRLMRRPVDAEVRRLLANDFDVEPLASGDDPGDVARAVSAALEAHAGHPAFVSVENSGGTLQATLYHAARETVRRRWPVSLPAVWSTLDIAVLEALVLEPLLGMPLSEQDDDEVSFTHDVGEAIAAVAKGERGSAMLVNPLRMADLCRVVDAGEVLPPKSTNFFPKAIAGLTFRVFGADFEARFS